MPATRQLLLGLIGLLAAVGSAPPAVAATIPTCRYDDLLTPYSGYADWSRTLVDTIYRVEASYAPPDLRPVSDAGLEGPGAVRSLVIDDLRAMAAAASAAGAPFAVESAYRSYERQQAVFNGWVDRSGLDQALLASARPGHSEHQLGLALDLRSPGGPSPWTVGDWAQTPAGGWLAAHAWEYGFVMSYPASFSPAETCYQYEPWHYRYVGRGTATILHGRGISVRAYLWSFGNDPDSLAASPAIPSATPPVTPTANPTPSPATPAPTVLATLTAGSSLSPAPVAPAPGSAAPVLVIGLVTSGVTLGLLWLGRRSRRPAG